MKKYKINLQVRVINFVMQSFVRLGLGPKHTYLLTVQGRKSGKPYTTPVTLMENQRNRRRIRFAALSTLNRKKIRMFGTKPEADEGLHYEINDPDLKIDFIFFHHLLILLYLRQCCQKQNED